MTRHRQHDLLDEPSQRMRAMWAAVFAAGVEDARRDPHDRWLDSRHARIVASLAGLDPDLVARISDRVRAEHQARALGRGAA